MHYKMTSMGTALAMPLAIAAILTGCKAFPSAPERATSSTTPQPTAERQLLSIDATFPAPTTDRSKIFEFSSPLRNIPDPTPYHHKRQFKKFSLKSINPETGDDEALKGVRFYPTLAATGTTGIYGQIRCDSTLNVQYAYQTATGKPQVLYDTILSQDLPRFELTFRYHRGTDGLGAMRREFVVYDHVTEKYMDGTDGSGINTQLSLNDTTIRGTYFAAEPTQNKYVLSTYTYRDSSGTWYVLVYNYAQSRWEQLVAGINITIGQNPQRPISDNGWGWMETYNYPRYSPISIPEIGQQNLEVYKGGVWTLVHSSDGIPTSTSGFYDPLSWPVFYWSNSNYYYNWRAYY